MYVTRAGLSSVTLCPCSSPEAPAAIWETPSREALYGRLECGCRWYRGSVESEHRVEADMEGVQEIKNMLTSVMEQQEKPMTK